MKGRVNMKRFEEKVVIITGGGAGLGQSAALQIAAEGGKLVLVDLNSDGLEETKQLILKENPEAEVLTITANVANEDEVKNYVDKTVEAFGRIDGFFNNAGIEGKQNLTGDYNTDEFHRVIDINLN